MNAPITRFAAVLVALATCAEAEAQNGTGVLCNVSSGYTPTPVYNYHPGWAHWSHAATAAESFARGHAAVIRARAEYNMTMAHVRAMETETRQRRLEYYYANKDTNSQYRESVRKPRITTEQATRLARNARPKDLSPAELDVRTGVINWPALLQADLFLGHRVELEHLLAQAAANGELAANQHFQLQQAAGAMQAELQTLVRQVDSMDYVEAKRFIETLACQARTLEG